jgi:phospholipid/cholesterol/gamma-HCH transport system permease protein
VRFQAIPSSARYFVRFLEGAPPKPTIAEESFATRVANLGWIITKKTGEWKDLIRFVGDFFLSTGSALHHFRRFRWRETLYYAQLSGSDAMPIVFLLSFLLGLVMAFQGAVQLRQFGANIFVADLLSLALTRELGPVFTAVILAGRSGSAFAAELGTMKVNEEVDALVVMGFDTTKFLVLPKVMALALCGPLLTMLANASGVLGGIVVGILSLDLTAASFVEEVYSILTLTDVVGGLAKSFVFSILIALIGCFRGLQADKGADSVGRQTTSAVVSGIFLIILADAVFTVVYHIFDI